MKSIFLNGYNLRKSFSFWIIILLVIVNGWYGKNLKRWDKNEIINDDVTQYYAYFPATFIYNDWTFGYVSKLPNDFEGRIWLLTTPDGSPVLKMTMGLSILWLPFETLAHLYAKLSHFNADGYSKPYSIGIFVSALFYLFLGLFYLRKLILNYFNEITVSITLIIIVLGTNLMHYVICEPGMSHVYNFCLITLVLYLTHNWLNKPGWIDSILIGIIVGFIVLIRPINIIVLIIPLLWNIVSFKEFACRLKLFLEKWKMILAAILTMFLILLPQFIYWKIATGHWIYYSYQDEKFFFMHPHIIDGLFSFRKGWFIYTPIMAIAFSGFLVLYKKAKSITLALIVTMGFAIYCVFSWWCWWYGGSFGSRPMIDFYGLMAIPLSALIFWVFKSKLWLKISIPALFVFLIYFNIIQMNQYRISLLHWDSMTKEAYSKILFKKDWPPDYEKLIKTPDYEKAKMGIDEY